MTKHRSVIAKRPKHLLTRLWRILAPWLKKIFYYGLVLSGVLGILVVGMTFLYASSYVNPVSTLMLVRMISGQSVQRQWVELDRISPKLTRSVIMSEDARFCSHKGVDWSALDKIIAEARKGERPRGASTISMQSVKNLYLWPERSYIRKALELPLTLLADRVWGKKRMIEIYLNVAEWDEGVFGIEAAARHYFKRGASMLSSRQSALLAATLPDPKHRNPAKPDNRLLRVAEIVKHRAHYGSDYVKCIE